MNILIVYAHPEPTSFNGAMRDLAVKTLQGAGHSVEMSDLYAMGFDPVTGAHDYTGTRSGPARLSIPREQTHAMETRTIAGKLAMVAATTGTSAGTYAPDGIDGDILTVLWPIHNGLLRCSGFDGLPPYVAFMPGVLARSGVQRNV